MAFGRRGGAGLGHIPLFATRSNFVYNNNTTGVPVGSRTRIKCRVNMVLVNSGTNPRLLWGNVALTTAAVGEANGAGDISIVKCSVEDSSGFYPVTVGGSRSWKIPAGSTGLLTDTIANFQTSSKKLVYIRFTADVPSGWVVNALQTAPASFLYDPVNEVDDVDATGAMAQPTGGTGVFPYYPLGIILDQPASRVVEIGFGDSIVTGDHDWSWSAASVATETGGGYLLRSAQTRDVPFFNCGISGRTVATFLIKNSFQQAIAKYCTRARLHFGSNDIAGGASSATVLTRLNSATSIISSALSSRKQVDWSKIIPRGVLPSPNTYYGTDLANQVIMSGFESGGTRDVVNAAMEASVGSNGLTRVIDINSVLADSGSPEKWALGTYSATLTAAVTSTQKTGIQASVAVPYGTVLVFNPGGTPGTNYPGCRVTTAGTNTTFAVEIATGFDAGIGTIIRDTRAYDLTHPSPAGYIDAAAYDVANYP